MTPSHSREHFQIADIIIHKKIPSDKVSKGIRFKESKQNFKVSVAEPLHDHDSQHPRHGHPRNDRHTP